MPVTKIYIYKNICNIDNKYTLNIYTYINIYVRHSVKHLVYWFSSGLCSVVFNKHN